MANSWTRQMVKYTDLVVDHLGFDYKIEFRTQIESTVLKASSRFDVLYSACYGLRASPYASADRLGAKTSCWHFGGNASGPNNVAAAKWWRGGGACAAGAPISGVQALPTGRKALRSALHVLEGADEAAADDDDGNQGERVTSSSSSYWKVLFELAHVKVQLRERDQAIALYRRIVEHESQFAEAHANLAAQLMIDGDLESALHHCTTALAIAPDFREAHYNMNVLLRRAGRQQEAIERYWGFVEREIGKQLQLTKQQQQSSESNQAPAKESLDPSPPAALIREVSNEDHRPPVALPVKVLVLCVKWGTKYGAEYVNKLYHSITRNSNSDSSSSVSIAGGESAIAPAVEIDFVCLTDDASGIAADKANLRCIPLEPGWKGWWNKLQVFSPRVSRLLPHSGKCLFVDLDTVIVNSLDKLLRWEIPKGETALLKTDDMVNEQRRDGYNSSIMMWRNEHDAISSSSSSLLFRHVYQLLHDHFSTISKFIYKFDHWLEMALPHVIFLEDVFPESIVEYRSLDETAKSPPENASIVCFSLQPKPHDASASWIQQHWQ